MTFEKETEANFQKFFEAWTERISQNWIALHNSPNYLASYRRISAVNSLRIDVLEKVVPTDALAFFLEAHNDLLQAHVSASVGSWRVALKSIRSFVENSLNCLYFADHSIELRNWERGKSRPGFSELIRYFENHPDIAGFDVAKSALGNLTGEYGILSKAVHGSAKTFRMTDNIGQTLLWSTKTEKVGSWSTREAAAIAPICILIITIYRSQLSGAKLPGCRQSLSTVLSQKVREKVKNELGITVPNN